MICKKCGNNVIDGSKFCPICGASIEEVNNNQVAQQQLNQNQYNNQFMVNNNFNNQVNQNQYSSQITTNNALNNMTDNNLNQNYIQGNINNSNLNNNPKKNNNKLIILFSILGGVLLLGIIITVVMLSLKTNNDNLDNSNNFNNEENINNNVTENGKRIGTEEFGYVTVPDNWVRFYDVDGSSTYQYSYATVWIVTLYAVPQTQIDAKSYASNVRYAMEYEEGATNVTGAQVSLGKYSAYQVYGYYPSDNVWLVSWYFEAEDGKTHYISIEGPDRYSDNFNIANTFSLDK